MTSSRLFALLALILLAPFAASLATAGPGTVPTGFQDQLVVGGLRQPVGMTFLPDGRLLFVEQNTTRIRLIVNGAISSIDPVCTVPGVVTGGEFGLLGIAVDPGWPTRPYVYVHYDHFASSKIRVARFTVTGDLAFNGNGSLSIDPASQYLVLDDIPDNATNHNGGTVRFGPDGMLHVSLGDDAVPCAAQDTVSLRGVILRLDVSNLPAGPGGPPAKTLIAPATNPFAGHSNLNARLVWTLGLRNPFRFSIDYDGTLFIGDVGEGGFEEIDRAPGGGVNLGWPLFEGFAANLSCAGISGDGMVNPIYDYPHSAPSHAVIGGTVYRYPTCSTTFRAFPTEYIGDYFFNEYYGGFLRRLKGSGNSWAIAPYVPGQTTDNWGSGFGQVSDWAVGCDGALWYCRQSVGFADNTGEIRRIVVVETTDVPMGSRQAEFRSPFPSPAEGAVTFDFSLATPTEQVALDLYDARGRRVRQLRAPSTLPAGRYVETWDGRDARGTLVPPGLYFAKLEVGGRPLVRRFIRL